MLLSIFVILSFLIICDIAKISGVNLSEVQSVLRTSADYTETADFFEGYSFVKFAKKAMTALPPAILN
jgi:hypothetical protein